MIVPKSSEADTRRPLLKNGALHADICIVGAGSGGLSVAAGAVQMGASVVLIEKGKMGGDCLNTGCVPSKALIAAAHAAQAIRTSDRLGVEAREPRLAFADVHKHIHGVIAKIAPHDSVERFEGLGVTVLKAAAKFVATDRIEAGSQVVHARRFVIATGSSAAVPPVPGLTEVPYLTNESIFDLTTLPEHLIVIGGGPAPGINGVISAATIEAPIVCDGTVGVLAHAPSESNRLECVHLRFLLARW